MPSAAVGLFDRTDKNCVLMCLKQCSMCSMCEKSSYIFLDEWIC